MIKDLFVNKTGAEKAGIKGVEIAKIGSVARTTASHSGKSYDVEIVSMKAIKDGVEVFARAWDANGQVGFGDGTVDLERFIFINPPISVDDPNGDIIQDNGEFGINRFREDPQLAILQTLAHTISVKKQRFDGSKIIAGKVGSTTLTAFPFSGTGTAPMDGLPQREAVDQTFANIRGGAGTAFSNAAANNMGGLDGSTTTDQFSAMYRVIVGFDTSSIGDTDTIDIATLSVAGNGNANNTGLGDTNNDITTATPTDGANLAAGDFAVAQYGSTRLATGTAISAFVITAGTYNNWTLNADGRAAINKTGFTYLAFRTAWDVDNSFTGTWASSGRTLSVMRYAETADTTSDPKLVVEYSVAAAANHWLLMGV